jgi:hypothetical protein
MPPTIFQNCEHIGIQVCSNALPNSCSPHSWGRTLSRYKHNLLFDFWFIPPDSVSSRNEKKGDNQVLKARTHSIGGSGSPLQENLLNQQNCIFCAFSPFSKTLPTDTRLKGLGGGGVSPVETLPNVARYS